jgi:hypothetical protein
MTIVVNPADFDRLVMFPDGKIHTINLLRMLVQTQNAEFKAAHNMFLPGVGKQHPTIKKLREEYAIPDNESRTWAATAVWMRAFYDYLSEDK